MEVMVPIRASAIWVTSAIGTIILIKVEWREREAFLSASLYSLSIVNVM